MDSTTTVEINKNMELAVLRDFLARCLTYIMLTTSACVRYIKMNAKLPSSCISLERGTLVFAIFNIVLVVLASIGSVVALIYWGISVDLQVCTIDYNPTTTTTTSNYDEYSTISEYDGERSYNNKMEDDRRRHTWECTTTVLWTMGSWILMTVSLVSLVFAALLIAGIVKRKPGLMKAYVVYGVVMVILSIIAAITVRLLTYRDPDIQAMFTASIIICFIYTGVLVMIRLTYRKIENLDSLHSELKLAMDAKAQQIPFSCMSVQTGTLTFAIFNTVITSLVSIASIVSLSYWGIGLMELSTFGTQYDYEFREVPAKMIYLFSMGSLILTTAALVSLLFAGLLICGVVKRKPELVKVYFVYGVVVDMLSVLAAIALLLLTYDDIQALWIVPCFISCFVYAGILVMIRQTYRKFEEAYCEDDHQKLVKAKEYC